MAEPRSTLAELRRFLQLETLYDLALALGAQRGEQELLDELLERVCSVLDPAAAVVVTRDAYGGPRGAASVGWAGPAPTGAALLGSSLWRGLLAEGHLLARADGALCQRSYRDLLATPLAYRGVYLGFLAVLDKEGRGSEEAAFSSDDRRFLDSVAVLAGVALDAARQVEQLEVQRDRLEEENKDLKERFEDEVAGRKVIAQAPPIGRALEIVEGWRRAGFHTRAPRLLTSGISGPDGGRYSDPLLNLPRPTCNAGHPVATPAVSKTRSKKRAAAKA